MVIEFPYISRVIIGLVRDAGFLEKLAVIMVSAFIVTKVVWLVSPLDQEVKRYPGLGVACKVTNVPFVNW